MERDYKKEIEEIKGIMECPRDFACYKTRGRPLCKAKDIGMKDYVRIVENGSSWCKYLIVLEEGYFCKCPLCVYLTKIRISPKRKPK